MLCANTVKGTKRQVTDGEKIFAKHFSDTGLVFKIFNNLMKFNNRKTATFKNVLKAYIYTNLHGFKKILISVYVLVAQSFPDKILQSGWLKQQKCFCSQSWMLNVRKQDAVKSISSQHWAARRSPSPLCLAWWERPHFLW